MNPKNKAIQNLKEQKPTLRLTPKEKPLTEKPTLRMTPKKPYKRTTGIYV